MALLGMALLETAGHFWHKGTFSSQSGVAGFALPTALHTCAVRAEANAWIAVAE